MHKPTVIEEAYGLLWLAATTDPRIHEARKRLMSLLDRDSKMRGVQSAMKIVGAIEAGSIETTGDKTPPPSSQLSGPHAGPPERAVHGLSETSGEKEMSALSSIRNSRLVSEDVGPSPEDHVVESVEPQNRSERHCFQHRSVLSGDLEGLPVYNVIGQNLLRDYLPSGQDSFIVGSVERGELSAFRIFLKGAVTSDIEVVPGHVISIHPTVLNGKADTQFQAAPSPYIAREHPETAILATTRARETNGAQAQNGRTHINVRTDVNTREQSQTDFCNASRNRMEPASEQNVRAYPQELTDDLRDLLSLMMWQTGPIAHALRDGGAEIPCKAELEQAHVLHWLTLLMLEFGSTWREKAADRIKEIRDVAMSRGRYDGSS